jgi:hypothetical protein
VFPVRYELGVHIPGDGILHSHRRENIKSYTEGTEFNIMEYVFVLLRTGANSGQL